MSPTMKTVRWFALVVIGNLAAALPASMALSATASATPSENTDAVVISQSTVDGVDYIEPAGAPLAVDVPDPGCGS